MFNVTDFLLFFLHSSVPPIIALLLSLSLITSLYSLPTPSPPRPSCCPHLLDIIPFQSASCSELVQDHGERDLRLPRPAHQIVCKFYVIRNSNSSSCCDNRKNLLEIVEMHWMRQMIQQL